MNIKSMFGIGLVSFGVAFAQDYAAPEAETYSAPAETSTNSYTATTTAPSMSEQELQKQEEQAASSNSLTAPVPFVKPDIPKESKRSSFNSILHGRSYNYNGNMAAANNTDLLMRYPNLFANRKFFYIEPTNKMGILSLGSFFTAFDIVHAPLDASQLGRLTLGYAVPGFGFYIRAGLGHSRVSNDGNATIPHMGPDDVDAVPGVTSVTSGGDDWAFAISKGFLGVNLALSGDWITEKKQIHIDPDQGDEREQHFDSLTVNVNLTNAPTAKNFTWNIGATLVAHRNEVEVEDDVVVDADNPPNSYFELAPYLRVGLSVLENDNARVIVGAAGIFPFRHYNDPLDGYVFAVILQPSLLGEVFVGEEKNFMFYGEVGYDWNAFTYNKDNNSDISTMFYRMNPVVASVGFRYQYKDFLSVELGLGNELFSGSGNFFNGDHTFVDFSAMVRF